MLRKMVKNLFHYLKHQRVIFISGFFLLGVLSVFVMIFVLQNKSTLIQYSFVRQLLPVYRPIDATATKLFSLWYLPKMSFDTSEVPQYELYIEPKHVSKLNAALPVSTSLEVILGQVFLSEEQKETVPAVFFYEGEKYDVKVRYRGDNPVHWVNEKRSWQVIFEKEKPFKGQRILKLIIPVDRNYFSEFLNNYRATKLGLKYPASDLAHVTINGTKMGLYLEIVDWDNEFLEMNQLPADANVYKTEDVAIRETGLLERNGDIFSGLQYWDQEAGDKRYDYQNYAEMDLLLRLLEEGKLGEYADSIIDLDNFYAWNIVHTLSGSTHAANIGNVRLFFNNSSGKFELIPWDVGLEHFSADDVSVANKISSQILSQDAFLLERNRRLWAYIEDKNQLDDDLAYYDELYETYRGLFYADLQKRHSNFEFDAIVAELRSRYIDNVEQLRNAFKTDNTKLHIELNEVDRVIELRFLVNGFGGVSINDLSIPAKNIGKSVLYYDSNNNGEFDSEDIRLQTSTDSKDAIEFEGLSVELVHRLSINRDLVTDSSVHTLFVAYEEVGTPLVNVGEIELTSRNAATGKKIDIPIDRISNTSTFHWFDDLQRSPEEFVASHPRFTLVENEIVLPTGTHIFSETVVVPPHTKLKIMGGATLLLRKNVSILSYSPVQFDGTSVNPINVRGFNDDVWGVFGVVNTKEVGENRVVYTNFVGGSEAYINGVYLSGMLSVYNGNLDIADSGIIATRGEDGLNVKYGNVSIVHTEFTENASDALDLDYASGLISENVFTDNGNDGIDLSGSRVFIAGNLVRNSGDKCISVGEGTIDTVLFSNELVGCFIGVEAKDGSSPYLINNYLAKNDTALNAYMKKPIYETGGHTSVSRTLFVDNKKNIETDEFSTTKVVSSLEDPEQLEAEQRCVSVPKEEVGGVDDMYNLFESNIETYLSQKGNFLEIKNIVGLVGLDDC